MEGRAEKRQKIGTSARRGRVVVSSEEPESNDDKDNDDASDGADARVTATAKSTGQRVTCFNNRSPPIAQNMEGRAEKRQKIGTSARRGRVVVSSEEPESNDDKDNDDASDGADARVSAIAKSTEQRAAGRNRVSSSVSYAKCGHRYNDGEECTLWATKKHKQNACHKEFTCKSHPTPNNLPCEICTVSKDVHHVPSLVHGTYGTPSGDREGESDESDQDHQHNEDAQEDADLSAMMPSMCPLCPLEKKGVDWDVALKRISGESDERYLERVSLVLDYNYTGQQDEQFDRAKAAIYDRREDENDIQYNTRVAVCRLGIKSLLRHLEVAHGVKKVRFRCMVPRVGKGGKVCKYSAKLIHLQNWIDHARNEHAEDLEHADSVNDDDRLIECPVCTHVLPRLRQEQHNHVHYEMHLCQVEGCDVVIENNREYGRHIRKDHTDIVDDIPGHLRDAWWGRMEDWADIEVGVPLNPQYSSWKDLPAGRPRTAIEELSWKRLITVTGADIQAHTVNVNRRNPFYNQEAVAHANTQQWVIEVDNALDRMLGSSPDGISGLGLSDLEIRFLGQPRVNDVQRGIGWFLGSIVVEEICKRAPWLQDSDDATDLYFEGTARFQRLSREELDQLRRVESTLPEPGNFGILPSTKMHLQRIVRTVSVLYNASEQEILAVLCDHRNVKRNVGERLPMIWNLFQYPVITKQPNFGLTTWSSGLTGVCSLLETWAVQLQAALEGRPIRNYSSPAISRQIYMAWVEEFGSREELAARLVHPSNMPSGTTDADKQAQGTLLRRLGEDIGKPPGYRLASVLQAIENRINTVLAFEEAQVLHGVGNQEQLTAWRVRSLARGLLTAPDSYPPENLPRTLRAAEAQEFMKVSASIGISVIDIGALYRNKVQQVAAAMTSIKTNDAWREADDQLEIQVLQALEPNAVGNDVDPAAAPALPTGAFNARTVFARVAGSVYRWPSRYCVLSIDGRLFVIQHETMPFTFVPLDMTN